MSFVIRCGPHYLHHNFVVAVLNDLFGIQARGGCSCAGPYGHRLLGIDIDHSHAFQREITGGCEGIKPGWTRVNFNYFISDAVCDYIISAVELLASDGVKLLADYRFDPETGLWHHRAGAVDPPLRLGDLRYDAAGVLLFPQERRHADDSAFEGYLERARRVVAERPDPTSDETPSGLSEDFESLRWFPLPAACLVR